MIHRYKALGKYVILDTESGSVFDVDRLAYEVAAFGPEFDFVGIPNELKDWTEEEIQACVCEMKQLIDEDLLFAQAPAVPAAMADNSPVIKAMCLHVAHDCNMSCEYCFAHEGSFLGERSLLSYETGVKAFDFLVAHSGTRRFLEVDFFGGEPLLNFDVVKKLVAYGREIEKNTKKRFRFTLTTNCLAVTDEVIEFADKEFVNVVLSLDGRKCVNDTVRKTRNGKGTYDLIIDNVKKFAEARKDKDHYVRGTYTSKNLDFDKDVLHLADCGFEQISVEPVVLPKDHPLAIKEEHLPEILEAYDRLAEGMLERKKIGNEFNFFHFIIDLEGGPCAAKRMSGCGAGREYIAVTPEGDIYPCHRFVGEKRFLIGNVTTGEYSLALRDEFATNKVTSKPECDSCWAKYYCGGGCSANSYYETGNVSGQYKLGCDIQKKRIELAVALKLYDDELIQDK